VGVGVAYKDCVLEGGQTRKRKSVMKSFSNETWPKMKSTGCPRAEGADQFLLRWHRPKGKLPAKEFARRERVIRENPDVSR